MTDGPARRVADQLGRRGLAVPGRLLLDAHRPLAPLIGDLGAALGPLLRVAAGRRADDVRALMDDPQGIEKLIGELERDPSREPRADAR